MKGFVSINIEDVASQVAEDNTGELMASFMAQVIKEHSGFAPGFGEWMQAAMNEARYLIPEKDAEEWADDFILRVEQAALKLY